MLNLFVQYMSTDLKNPNKIYLPFFFGKYNRDGSNLEHLQIKESLPKFFAHISKTLTKNQ